MNDEIKWNYKREFDSEMRLGNEHEGRYAIALGLLAVAFSIEYAAETVAKELFHIAEAIKEHE